MAQLKYYKIKEFQAHSPTVNCASIGRKSYGVIVTGGDDRLINLWTIGTDARTMSLSGLQSSVESVVFDADDVRVAAGSASGVLKVFDLETTKVSCSLPGHKCNIRALDFTPEWLVSGSNDTNVKIWDLSMRHAAHTCKGHKAPILHVRMSPDGRWVASGDQDGQVRIFDFKAGKVLREFNDHTHAITGLEFHPNECILATSSLDKTVKVWDPDERTPLSSTPSEATGVRAMAFHPKGDHIFAAMQDGLKIWQWDSAPPVQLDNIDIPWSKVNNLTVCEENQSLVGCSFSSSFVGVWILPFEQMNFTAPVPATNQYPVQPGRAPSVRSGVPTPPLSSRQSVGAASDFTEERPPVNLHDFALKRNGQLSNAAYSGTGQAAARGPSTVTRALEPTFQNLRLSDDRRKSGGRSEAPPSESASNWRRQSPAPSDQLSAYTPTAHTHYPLQPPLIPRPPGELAGAHNSEPQPHMVSIGVGVGDSLMRGQVVDTRQQHMGAAGQRGLGGGGAVGRVSADPLADALKGSDATLDILNQRQATLRVMRSLLQKGDLRGAMQAGRRAPDPLPAADLLGALLRRRGFNDILDLTCLPELVPVLEAVLSMRTVQHVQVAVEMGLFVCKNLGPTIRDVCATPADGSKRLAVDMAFEQRRARCEAARLVLQGLRIKLAAVARQHGGNAPLARQMTELSDQLESACGP